MNHLLHFFLSYGCALFFFFWLFLLSTDERFFFDRFIELSFVIRFCTAMI